MPSIVISQEVIDSLKKDGEITVKMTESTFEAFLAFRKQECEISTQAERALKTLRAEHENLCSLVLDSIDIADNGGASVRNDKKAAEAVSLAGDWF